MSQKDYTTELLGLEDAEIEKVEEGEESIVVTFSLLRKTHICPHCGTETDLVHDYRVRELHDTSTAGNACCCVIDDGGICARYAASDSRRAVPLPESISAAHGA